MAGTQRNRGGGSLLAEGGTSGGGRWVLGPPPNVPSILLPVRGLPGAGHVPGVALSESSPLTPPLQVLT